MATVEDDTAGGAKRTDLAGVDKFEVFEDWYEDEWFSLAYVDDGHIKRTYGCSLPE